MSDFEPPPGQAVITELMLETAQKIIYVEQLRVVKEKFLHRAAVIGRAVASNLFEGLSHSNGVPNDYTDNTFGPRE